MIPLILGGLALLGTGAAGGAALSDGAAETTHNLSEVTSKATNLVKWLVVLFLLYMAIRNGLLKRLLK